MDKPSRIDPVDAYVGQRLRLARELRGFSQTKLASCEALTFQQIQKYEHGITRVSCSRLYHFAEHLGMPVPWFFDGLAVAIDGDTDPAAAAMRARADAEMYRMLRLFYSVNDELHRSAIVRILRSVVQFVP